MSEQKLIETIKERLNYKDDNPENYYIKFDFSGYGNGDSDRSDEGNDICRLRNLDLIQNNFSDYLPDLGISNFKLWSWKGVIWWGEQKNWENMFKDFTGWATYDIIEWIILNRPHQENIMEILGEEDRILNKIYDQKNKELNEIVNTPKILIYRNITRQKRYDVLKRQKWRCNICAKMLKFNNRSNWNGEVAHIDHIHPYTKRLTYPNGKENINESENLQGLCPKCNLSKNKKDIN